MTRSQIVIGDGNEGPPYPEDRWPGAEISKKSLLAAIRRLQEKVRKLEGAMGGAERIEQAISHGYVFVLMPPPGITKDNKPDDAPSHTLYFETEQ